MSKCVCIRPHTRAYTNFIRDNPICPECKLCFAIPILSDDDSFTLSDSEFESSTDGYDTVYTESSNSGNNSPLPEMDVNNTLQQIANSHLTLIDALHHKDLFQYAFSGLPSENIHVFFQKFDNYCVNFNKNVAYQLRTLPSLLDKRAYEFYDSLPAETKTDLVSLKEQLIDYFTPQKLPPLFAYERLHKLTMGDSNVQEYFERLMAETRHLNLPDVQLTALFVNGLPVHIKNYVRNKNPANLKEALKLAREQEVIGPPPVDENTLLLRKLVANQKQISSFTRPHKTKICYVCNSPGHISSQCFAKKSHINPKSILKNRRNIRPYNQINSQQSTLTCQACGQLQHSVFSCPHFTITNNTYDNNTNFDKLIARHLCYTLHMLCTV